MTEIDEHSTFLRSKKSSDLRNAKLLGQIFRSDSSHLIALSSPKNRTLRQLRVGTSWVLRARSFYSPSVLEEIASLNSQSEDLRHGGANKIANEMKRKALELAIKNEKFEMALALVEDSDEFPEYFQKARECLFEIHHFQDLLASICKAKELDNSPDRVQRLSMFLNLKEWHKQCKSSRAEHLKIAANFRLLVFLKKYQSALALSSKLKEYSSRISNLDVLRANIQVISLNVVLGNYRAALKEMDRLSILEVSTIELQTAKLAEVGILMFVIALEVRDKALLRRALLLTMDIDHDQCVGFIGTRLHSRLCSLIILGAGLADMPTAAERVLEKNHSRVKYDRIEFHLVEVASAGHYLLNFEWVELQRIGKRFAKMPITKLGEFWASLISRLLSNSTIDDLDRRKVLSAFITKAAELGEVLNAQYPIAEIIKVKLGENWGVIGDNQNVVSNSNGS